MTFRCGYDPRKKSSGSIHSSSSTTISAGIGSFFLTLPNHNKGRYIEFLSEGMYNTSQNNFKDFFLKIEQ